MAYLVSLLVGLAVGAAYALLSVKSPAPPMVALIGLLGMVIGEQGLPWVKEQIAGRHTTVSSTLSPQPKLPDSTAIEAEPRHGWRTLR